MKLMGKRAWILMALCIAFMAGIAFYLISYVRHGAAWATYPVNAHLYSGGRLISSGSILDRGGAVLASTQDGVRTYHENKTVRTALMHTVGDAYNFVGTSLQSAFRKQLTGWNHFTGAYHFGSAGEDIVSTVDAETCRVAYEALGGRNGAVGVMNYRTGELICVVSAVSFDPADPPDVEANPEKYEGVYLNRLFSSSYAPGSVFKLVTAAAAIETIPDLTERTFTCSGEHAIGDGKITCSKAHGSQTFAQALTNSCNITFASLALEMGPKTMTRYAEAAGCNSSLSVDGIRTLAGSFSLEGAADADIGWAGVGQYRTLVNPMAFLQYMGAIANHGERVAPRIVRGNAGQQLVGALLGTSDGRALPEATADTLKTLMRRNVTEYYGDAGLAGYNLCAKTGTAEVGGDRRPHSWFTGFLDSEEAPLAFVVIVENAGAGSGAAMETARAVLGQAVKAAG